MGVFANVSEPRGLLHLSDLDPPQVAVCSGGDSEIKFFSMSGAPTGTVKRQGLVPYDVDVHPDDPNAIMVAYMRDEGFLEGTTQVRAECVPGQQCTEDYPIDVVQVDADPCACDVSAAHPLQHRLGELTHATDGRDHGRRVLHGKSWL